MRPDAHRRGGLPARIVAGTVLVALLCGCQPRAVEQHPIFAAVRQDDTQTLSRYLAEGGDPDARDRNGHTLVYIAAGALGGADAIGMLVRAGADPDLGTGDGRTPLQHAASWCDAGRVQALLAAGADPNRGRDGTALDAVCSSPADRRAEVIAILEAAMAG